MSDNHEIMRRTKMLENYDKLETFDFQEFDISCQSNLERKMSSGKKRGRNQSSPTKNKFLNRSTESKYSNDFEDFISEEDARRTMENMEHKQKMKINMQKLQKSSKVPNIQVRNVKKSPKKKKKASDGIDADSRLLKDTINSSQRFQNSQEQILKK